MTMDEYQNKAMRTSPEDGHDRMKNGCLGLIGETGELVDAVKKYIFQSGESPALPVDKIAKEAGDVLWYCAEAITGMGMRMSEVFPGDFALTENIKPQQMPSYEKLKRLERTAVGLSFSAMHAYQEAARPGGWAYFPYVLMEVIWGLARLSALLGTTLESVAVQNIEKLLRRYPDGFDPNRSINRME